MDEAIQVSCIIDKLPPSWKDFKHTLKHKKEDLNLVELGSHLRIKESLGSQDSDKPKGNNVFSPSVINMVEHNNSSRYNDNKGKRKHHDNTKGDPNKKFKVTCWKCGKPGHLKKDCKSGKVGNKANETTINVCKDRCWFKTYESLNDGSILHMGNESIALVHGRDCVDLSYKQHARLGHVHFKRMQDMSKDGLIPTFDMDTENDLCDLHATPSLGNEKYFVTFIDDASRPVVRLSNSKLKTLGERGIECIFFGYAEHSKAFRFFVIEPNDSVAINSIIESRDVIFNENRFSLVPRPSLRIPNGTEDIGGLVVPEKVVQQPEPELRKSKRNRNPKNFRPEFQLYLIEETKDEVFDQHSYCFNVEDDPKTFDEAMKKLKVDGTIEKFKARLLIQGFKQNSGIYYFDTYSPVARISTIRLLIAMASIHNLIIHHMDVKRAFLNGDLEKEAPKQWHQKFDEVVLSNGYLLNQADKCVYSKFDETGKGVIICLYVDDMLIFGTDQVQVDLTKEFLSSKFSMKDMRKPDVILGIRIKHESNGIAISQSHYIEKVLKKFSYFDSTLVSTPMDTSEKLMPNNGQVVSQLEYSRASKKQTCIAGSTMKSKFVALAAAGKEAKWLKNLLLEIPLWSKPITPIFIRYDSAATLAKAYSQMYNGKFRHLGVRHSMIHELITNGVISIEYVSSQQNLADHLTNGLTRDLVIKSTEWMGLKSN
ncbi:zinc finger, CCHC-type containing protein [Tanacetum coccineum]